MLESSQSDSITFFGQRHCGRKFVYYIFLFYSHVHILDMLRIPFGFVYGLLSCFRETSLCQEI